MIDLIVGTRPNLVKVAALIRAILNHNQIYRQPIDFRLIHTGQHYDETLSQSFFDQLGLPAPDVNFRVGSGSQAEQLAQIVVSYEHYLKIQGAPKLCIVVGDVNSTLACALAAVKLGVAIAHVEAGIRSGDLSMPEEVNRIATDAISTYFFTTTSIANQNLIGAGAEPQNIFLVGNTMIDTLTFAMAQSKTLTIEKSITRFIDKRYVVMTLHRPSNVDDSQRLASLIADIRLTLPDDIPIIFPVHPRTKSRLNDQVLSTKGLYFCPPLPYFEFMHIVSKSFFVITDSGGLSEETSFLNIPCITLRSNTERPETVELGTNTLVGEDRAVLKKTVSDILRGQYKKGSPIPYWDGRAGERIIDIVRILLGFQN